MSSFRHTVDPTSFEVYIYSDGQSEPIVYQPHNPDMSDWTSADEAETWATDLIAKFEADIAAMETPAE